MLDQRSIVTMALTGGQAQKSQKKPTASAKEKA